MTKKKYEEELTALMQRYRDEVIALQERYEKGYKDFKVGDLCRDQKGFKSFFIIEAVRHIRNNGDIYTILDGITTNKEGKAHGGSRKDAFRDTETTLIRSA